jgi:hypothetical protein
MARMRDVVFPQFRTQPTYWDLQKKREFYFFGLIDCIGGFIAELTST